jgi:hypothetical protein
MTLIEKDSFFAIVADAKARIEEAKAPIRRASLSADNCNRILAALDNAQVDLNEAIRNVSLEDYTDK